MTLGEIFWLITDICIVVFIFLAAVAALIYWIMGAANDRRRIKYYRNMNTGYAETADDMLNDLYREKAEHGRTVEFYTGVIERKDKKIDSLVTWDEKKSKRITQLEKQLRENGIEPAEWEFVA